MSNDNWYSIEKLDDGVSLILENHISDEWRCNIWHVRGRDCDLIIDTGLGFRPIAEEITEITERPIIAVCTHSHHDHSGGLHQFEARFGHGAEADIFANPTRETTTADLLEAKYIKSLPHDKFDIETWCVEPAALTHEIDEGDVIDLGDRQFHVLHFPGHSPGSIALWEEDSGIIFTGDTLYDGVLYDQLYHSVPGTFRESLYRLKEMPVSTVHAGHDTSFDRARMEVIIDEYMSGQRSMLCPS